MTRFRLSRFRIYLCTLVAVLGLGTAGLFAAASASAMPAPGGPVAFSPTAACQVEFGPDCAEPVAAQAVPATHNLIPGDDAAMTVTGPGGAVGSSLDNDQQDGTQDWVFAQDGTATGLYAGDPIFEVEWAPFGFDIGLCDQVNVNPVTHTGKVVLRPCDGGADQQFIIAKHIPLAGFAPGPYVWALSLLPAVNAQHHLCLTMPHYLLGSQLTTTRCVHQTPGHGGPQFWTAIH